VPISGRPATASLTGLDADFPLSQLARHGHSELSTSAQTALLPVALHHIVRRSLISLIGSEEMALQLFRRRSVDCIAARFDSAIPETYCDENINRASILVGGRSSEVQSELIKMILYLMSNRLILGQQSMTNFYYHSKDMTNYRDDVQALISLCRLCGLAERRTIEIIVGLSRTCPTLMVVVEVLFEAAVNSEAVDIVAHLLDLDERIDLEKKVGVVVQKDGQFRSLVSLHKRQSPLVFAVLHGSTDLAKALLDRGADIHQGLEPYTMGLIAAAVLHLCPGGRQQPHPAFSHGWNGPQPQSSRYTILEGLRSHQGSNHQSG